MRIVALVPGGIGDQILFFPTLDALKQSYPDAEVDVVVEPGAKSAYRLSKVVNDVLTFDYQDRNSPADWANLLGVMRDRCYTAALYAGKGWGVELLLWLTGIPTRIGYTNSAGKIFLTNTIPFKAEQYIAHQYCDLLQGLQITAPCPDPTISIPKRDLDWAEAEQKRLGTKGSGYVLMQVGPVSFGNRERSAVYPSGSWKEIIRSFRQQQPDLPLVLLHGGSDPALIAELVEAYPELKTTQPGDVGKVSAMLAGANLFLCTAPALIPLAVALQVYTLALLGNTEPTQIFPASDKFVAIQSSTGAIADIPASQVLTKIWGG
jgi:ADP-heptose:LPS heptosyltransferase